MRQTYSSSSNENTEEPLESYSSYKERVFSKHKDAINAFLNNVASSSLKLEDKKLLLVRMKAAIEEDLFTRF